MGHAYLTGSGGGGGSGPTPVTYNIYGVAIDLTNSNPETSVNYTNDAVGMTGGSDTWDVMPIFKDIKPCVFRNGFLQYYLNPLNYTQKADGSAANITGADGDVMVEIPKIGYKIETTGNTLTVQITDNPDARLQGFRYYAHTRATEGDRDKLYVGAYLGQTASGKFRSISGVDPDTYTAMDIFRTAARANGNGYDLLSFYPLILIQCLYIIRFKNLDSQTALGLGVINTGRVLTGGTNTNGMFFGETTGTIQVKCFGIEDLWGNLRFVIEGLICDSSLNIFTAFNNFTNAGSGYTNRGKAVDAQIDAFMSKPQGTSEKGFLLKEGNGSESTFFCDKTLIYPNIVFVHGGTKGSGYNGGIFFTQGVYYTTSNAGVGGRLMYL